MYRLVASSSYSNKVPSLAFNQSVDVYDFAVACRNDVLQDVDFIEPRFALSSAVVMTELEGWELIIKIVLHYEKSNINLSELVHGFRSYISELREHDISQPAATHYLNEWGYVSK